MPKQFRLHIEIDTPRSPRKHWTFDDPTRVSFGFAPRASVWLYDPSAGAERTLFEKHKGRIAIRVDPDLSGSILTGEASKSFEELRSKHAAQEKGRGFLVDLNATSEGTVHLGETPIRFKVTPSPEDPEFPLHPRFYYFVRRYREPVVAAVFLSFLLHFGALKFFQSLPPLPQLDITEMDRDVVRFIIPEGTIPAPEKPRVERLQSLPEQRDEKPRRLSAPSATGFLAAAKKRGAGDVRSPFSNLFASHSLGTSLNKALKAGTVAEYNLKGAGASVPSNPFGSATSSPEKVTFKGLDRAEARLHKEETRPTLVPLSLDASQIEGTIDRDELARMINQNSVQLQDCYEQLLARKPGVAGKLVLSLMIGTEGRATSVKVEESSLQDRGMESCVVSRVSAWRFPPSQGGATPVRVPLFFTSASKG